MQNVALQTPSIILLGSPASPPQSLYLLRRRIPAFCLFTDGNQVSVCVCARPRARGCACVLPSILQFSDISYLPHLSLIHLSAFSLHRFVRWSCLSPDSPNGAHPMLWMCSGASVRLSACVRARMSSSCSSASDESNMSGPQEQQLPMHVINATLEPTQHQQVC